MLQWRLAGRSLLRSSCVPHSFLSKFPEPFDHRNRFFRQQIREYKASPHQPSNLGYNLRGKPFLAFSLIFLLFTKKKKEDEEAEARRIFEQWLVHHKKTYNSITEKEKRFEIFRHGLRQIETHNSDPNQSFKIGLNQFSDLSYEEFLETYGNNLLGKNMFGRLALGHNFPVIQYKDGDALPDSVDWRDKDVLTPIKNQLKCASCYAFAAVGAVEAIHKIRTGNLIPLSEQEIIDCDPWNLGCRGGFMVPVFMFMIANDGIAREEDYPYTGRDDTCDDIKRTRAVTINGFGSVARDEQSLKKAVAIQPVSVGMTSCREFWKYTGGIFKTRLKTRGGGRNQDHAMLLVGYGTTEEGEDFWILRNSWGPEWGEKGYVRMARNIAVERGILNYAVYPIK